MGRRRKEDSVDSDGVLKALFNGLGIKEIVYRFSVSEGTVRRIKNDFPLFFGMPRSGSYRGRQKEED